MIPKNSIFAFILLTPFLTGCSVFGIRSEETPKYQVVEKDESFEIRKYEPYIIAKTTVPGDFDSAQTPAFKTLANYIFGENNESKDMPMTAPVTQSLADKKSWDMAFYMPSNYTLETLPKPNSENISLEKLPARLVATIQYTWSGTEKRNAEKAEKLLDWLKDKPKYKIVSPPVYAGYDPPWTLPFLRKNEIHFEVEKVED